MIGVVTIVWYNSKAGKEIIFAKQKDVISMKNQIIECSNDFKNDLIKYPKCMPDKCARIVTDELITSSETNVLLNIAIDGLKYGGSDGGASILDLHSGALSKGSTFINIYSIKKAQKLFTHNDFSVYKNVKNKIQHAIAHHFGIDVNKLYLTKPTFFSRINNKPAKTTHDEYWLPHVDKITYEHFHYTSLLYLNDFDKDFQGGRFIFIDKHNVNTTIEPRKGRVSMFTSGSENLHAVERVTSGTRYALTISFTCNIEAGITDPVLIG
ncbi:2-oxoglutarate and iron-dependent oxygenase domain-containing protein 3-like isoform X2 [Aphidius gifuensis]|nr:2-oxoglutarate and iron-dependent oxygenase domain-containing protein 3-like isoform X2 [Aphidius gifuensis]